LRDRASDAAAAPGYERHLVFKSRLHTPIVVAEE
jgi:hypothetical protein